MNEAAVLQEHCARPNFKWRSLGLAERKQLLAIAAFSIFLMLLSERVIAANCTSEYARENPAVSVSGICLCVFRVPRYIISGGIGT